MDKTTTLEERINYCVSLVGTQTEFVRQSKISRSQLTRYLGGKSQPNIIKLVEIANISGTNLSWLVTGNGNPCKTKADSLSLSYDVMQQVIEVFEETLMEHPTIQLTPRLKSIMLPMIQAEIEHEKKLGVSNGSVDKTSMVDILEFLTCVNKANMIETYKDNVFKLLSSTKGLERNSNIGSFVNTACKAVIDGFSMETGENYCQRTRDNLNNYAKKSIFKIMETLFTYNKQPKIEMLDMGCGSGRFMEFIHKNYEKINVKGIEPSTLPFNHCKQKEFSGAIPQNSVVKCDARDLPLENGSIDFVMSKAVLHWIPYFKDSEFGTNKVFSEVARVLKPGGSFYFDMRHSLEGHREYLPFNQTYTKEDVQTLAQIHGFKIIWIHIDSDPYFPELIEDSSNTPDKYKDFISVFAVKV